MNFHETIRGQRFFDGDVPRIAKSLDSIAKSLEKLAASTPVAKNEPAPTDFAVHSERKTYRVFDIDYVCDDPDADLPEELTVKLYVSDETNIYDELCEAASDETGFLVNCFQYEEITKTVPVSRNIKEEEIEKAVECLYDNGIEKGEAGIVLQAIGYILLDTDLFPEL